MAKSVTIKLTSPIEGHEAPITEVVLREPAFADFMALGDPAVVSVQPGGGNIVVVNDDVVRQYVERCVVSPNVLLLTQLDLRDSMAVRDTLLDFFTKARSAPSAS